MKICAMPTLGIETSCDETAAAVVGTGGVVLSNVLASQARDFAVLGGVVPEMAARGQVDNMIPVLDQALRDAETGWEEIDQIAVTHSPGLIGSLIVGRVAAETLAFVHDKPLQQVNHLRAHVLANWLHEKGETAPEIDFPAVALLVSGGHTQLICLTDLDNWQIIGQTRDDAAGEAFDKVGALLGLGYPGGPAVSKTAKEGNPQAYDFPRARLEKDSLDFSFSGLKTAVSRVVNTEGKGLSGQQLKQFQSDVAASFEAAVVDILVEKTINAASRYNAASVLLAGGVAANKSLRARLAEACGDKFHVPKAIYCTDNAAMVGVITRLNRLDKSSDNNIME